MLAISEILRVCKLVHNLFFIQMTQTHDKNKWDVYMNFFFGFLTFGLLLLIPFNVPYQFFYF
jgi:hypothetical protein